MSDGHGVSISRAGSFIEKMNISGVDIFLIGGGNGAEVIRHHIAKGVNWYLGPEGDWSGFEYIFNIVGRVGVQY